jgi:hypothetical protein
MLKSPEESILDRRAFARAAWRFLVVGAVIAVTFVLNRRHQIEPAVAGCANRGRCGGCGRFVRCELPRARSIRRALAKT